MIPATKADGILLTETSFAVAQPITAAQKMRSLQHKAILDEEKEPDIDTDKVTDKIHSQICTLYSSSVENRDEQNDTEQKRPPYHRCGSSGDASDILLSETSSSFDSDDEISLHTFESLKREMSLDEVDALESSKQEMEMLLNRKEEWALEITKEEKDSKKEFDVSAYMSWREMTPLQERINAITVIPNSCYCLYFLLAGKWLGTEVIERAREAMGVGDSCAGTDTSFFASSDEASFSWTQNMMEYDPVTIAQEMSSMSFYESYEKFGCIRSTMFPSLHALPPLPVLAATAGFILHTPFSFMYHWKYAHRLPPGLARIEHWSRRFDHVFMHVICTCMSYATSGSWNYFLACAMLNADCIYRQFLPEVRPRRNLIRIGLSVIAYTMPILWWGNVILFGKIYAILLICFWLFAGYPIGGWSHSVFHATIALLPPLLMTAACDLSSSRAQIQTAAMCAVLKEEM
mmetsp:Transcript_490/g.817  ORF Transcript_490/g.817 Transcript_490/m.817 type:complete len:461 (+) Transcript_490:145-1527(+)